MNDVREGPTIVARPQGATVIGPRWADKALGAAAGFWLAAALLGQWAFFYYIAMFYGPSTLSGQFEIWNRLEALGASPYVPGDTAGNIAFLTHALGAGLIAFGGALQLIPRVRTLAPRFHRWNGRLFLLTAVVLSLTGFYLVWVRGTPPDQFQELSTTFNGVLILCFAVLAYRSARARQFTTHRPWAMRLYLVCNAQWFLRVGVFAYFAFGQLLGADVGFDDSFIGFWTFGCYLVPLAVLECYLRASRSGGTIIKTLVACGVLGLGILMGMGAVAFGAFSQIIVSGEPLAFPG